MQMNMDASMKDIEFVQHELNRLISDRGLCSILGEECTDRMAKWDNIINSKKDEPFSLVVIGDFKRGKSTIINAILGQNVAPTNVAPETFTINCISYGEVPSVEAVLKNGKRENLMKDDLKRDRLSELIDFFPGELDYIDVRSDSAILKDIRIVDTPGLSDLDELDNQVQDFLLKADAVIYVASALSPFSESEQFFIASHIVPLNFSRLFVLVNMIDAMNTMEDIEKIVNRVQERCDSIMPNAVVYGISGIDEYRRKIGLNRPDIKGFQEYYENEFLKFEMALKREIIVQKDTIRRQRVFSMLKIMLNDTLNRLNMISDMLRMDREHLDTLSAELKAECTALASALERKKPIIRLCVTEMMQEAERWMYEFFSKLRDDIVACRVNTEDKDVEKHFYSFLMDKVGEAYRKCLEIHHRRLNEVISDLGNELSRKLGIENLSVQNLSSGEIVSINSLDVADTVKQAALRGVNEQSFPSATMDAFKKILHKKHQTEIIDTTLENYDDIRNNTVKDLKAVYKTFENYAYEQLDNIYQNQAETGSEAVAQAIAMSKNSDNENIRKNLEKASEIVIGAVNVLKKY